MKVAIVGAGAIGCSLAVHLHESRAAATLLVARGDRAKMLRRGFTFRDAQGERTVHVPVSTRPPKDADVVVIATKTQDVDTAVADAAKHARHATFVTAQNGLAAEEIAARHVPAPRVVGCVVTFPAVMDAPDRVSQGPNPAVVLGAYNGPVNDRVRDVAHLFQVAGIRADVTDRLRGARWTKLLVNLQNAIPAALDVPIQQAYEDDRVRRIAVRMMREGLACVRKEGTTLEPIPWTDPRAMTTLRWVPVGIAGRRVAARLRALFGDHPIRGSTWQSLQRRKPTEIDHLNGEVVAQGRRLGVPTPWNAVLTRAVHHVEESGRHLTVDELVRGINGPPTGTRTSAPTTSRPPPRPSRPPTRSRARPAAPRRR